MFRKVNFHHLKRMIHANGQFQNFLLLRTLLIKTAFYHLKRMIHANDLVLPEIFPGHQQPFSFFFSFLGASTSFAHTQNSTGLRVESPQPNEPSIVASYNFLPPNSQTADGWP